jgi:anti-anti-sigma factor
VDLSKSNLADVTVAAPAGQIDHPNAQRLQEALEPILEEIAASEGSLLLDFGAVEYISSMGLRVLMMTAKRMHSHGGRIAVAALQPAVAEIFEIARFKHVLEAFPSVRAALEALSPAALAAYDATAR